LTDETLNSAEDQLLGVSQEQIQAIITALDEGNLQGVRDIVQGFDPADVAVALEYLPSDKRHDLVEILRPNFDPEILAELADTVREDVAEQLGSKDLAAAVAELDSDDAVAVLEYLEEDQQREVLDAIPVGERVILEEVLTYPEYSAARLMQREIVCVPSFWTVKQSLEHIRNEKNLPDRFFDVFVVDPKHQPIGEIPLSELLKHHWDKAVVDIMWTDIKRIPATMDQEEVAILFRKYNLVSSPVVDEEGRIIGMVTIDDVVDVIDEEAEEDIMHLAGVSESDFFSPMLSTSYARIRWLVITLINTLLAVTVISQFEATIQQMVALAVLMPIAAAMGGNSGMQVVTVTVRALATRELGATNMTRSVMKEVVVGLINGVVFGAIMGTIAGFWFGEWSLGVVLACAMLFNMLWAALAGTLLPLGVARMGMDPAISAGPLLTTTTDIFGFAIFLGLAKIFLLP